MPFLFDIVLTSQTMSIIMTGMPMSARIRHLFMYVTGERPWLRKQIALTIWQESSIFKSGLFLEAPFYDQFSWRFLIFWRLASIFVNSHLNDLPVEATGRCYLWIITQNVQFCTKVYYTVILKSSLTKESIYLWRRYPCSPKTYTPEYWWNCNIADCSHHPCDDFGNCNSNQGLPFCTLYSHVQSLWSDY